MNTDIKVFWGIILVTLVILGGVVWVAKSSRADQIVARGGLHWHAQLAIYIKGEKQEIPAGIGIGAVEQPIHTHDTSGTVHMEFASLVKKDDLKLGQFFKIWGKQFNSNGKVEIIVNGEQNQEFENYQMHDGDNIEIRYE